MRIEKNPHPTDAENAYSKRETHMQIRTHMITSAYTTENGRILLKMFESAKTGAYATNIRPHMRNIRICG